MDDRHLLKKQWQEIIAREKEEQERELRESQAQTETEKLEELWRRMSEVNSRFHPRLRLASRKKTYSRPEEAVYTVDTLGPLGRDQCGGIYLDTGSLGTWVGPVIVRSRRGIFESGGDAYNPTISYTHYSPSTPGVRNGKFFALSVSA